MYLENDRVYGWDAKDPLVPTKKGKPSYDPAKFGKMQSNAFGGVTEAHRRYDNRQTGTILSEKTITWQIN